MRSATWTCPTPRRWAAPGMRSRWVPRPGHGPPGGPNPLRVLDVRQRGEWVSGHLPGARHAELGTLTDAGAVAAITDGPVAVMCGHGERAVTGASLLAAGDRKS